MKRLLPWLLPLFFACPPPTTSDPPEEDFLSLSPEAVAPENWNGGELLVTESLIPPPTIINHHLQPIGLVYEVIVAGEPQGSDFGSEYAILDFPVNKERLLQEGYLPEFMVFYQSEDQNWYPVDKLEVLENQNLVRAYTSHLTPFVLTALPESSTDGSSVPEPPLGIHEDFPHGIGGSGNAQFTVVGENYTYYQDRSYYIRPLDDSPINRETFEALGLHGALGIATINGNNGMGPFADHKRFTGQNYIQMVAHMDLDVYLLYDTRGGTGATDYSQDAPWISATGFTHLIATDQNPTPRTYYLETTDAVGRYAIYHRAFSENEEIRLHGNRNGVNDPGINTNYWVIFKRQGIYESESASNLLVEQPDTIPPDNVGDLRALIDLPNIELSWTKPTDVDFKAAVIRLSNDEDPVTMVTDGIAPQGSPIGDDGFQMTGAQAGGVYAFTVFAIDENLNYHRGGAPIQVTVPSLDPDLSGYISDYGNPVPGALIGLFDGSGFEEYTVSDILGYYEFTTVPSGTYSLVINRDGYAPITRIVTIP